MAQGNTRSVEVEVFPGNVSVQVQTPLVGIPAGLTWGDFKRAGDALMSDGELLASIDYHNGQEWTGQICAERGAEGVEIREAR